MKYWYELKIHVEHGELVRIEDRLDSNDSVLAITYKPTQDAEDCLEPLPGEFPIWDDSTLTALFDKEDAVLHALHDLRLSPEHYQINVMPNENWIEKCRKHFKPKKFGERIWLCPTWDSVPESDAIIVKLDPGVAFGTGEHETTSLCMTWLDANIKPEQSVLDYGCGTGILAIASLKLGASRAVAVDIDPQAVNACCENAKLNDVGENLIAVHSDDYKPEQVFDVVVSNILARPLISLKPRFLKVLRDSGRLVVSGILKEQSDWIKESFSPDFVLESETTLNSWVCLCFKKIF